MLASSARTTALTSEPSARAGRMSSSWLANQAAETWSGITRAGVSSIQAPTR